MNEVDETQDGSKYRRNRRCKSSPVPAPYRHYSASPRPQLTPEFSNFAGVIGPMVPITQLSAEDFQKCMAVNSTGVLLSTKYELKQMMTQSSIEVEEGRPPQQGAIVNCASINSMFSLPGTVAYTASKHAVNGITKAVGHGPCPFVRRVPHPSSALFARIRVFPSDL